MKLTTPKPPIDLLEVLPELADLRATAVRLHPRKGRLPNRYGSKLGGTFLWPADEPWPVCDERWPPSWTPYIKDGFPVPQDVPRARPFPLIPCCKCEPTRSLRCRSRRGPTCSNCSGAPWITT